MPEWIKDAAPVIAIISILVNIALFMAKRRLEIRDKEEKRALEFQDREEKRALELKDKEEKIARDAELERQRISREIAGKLATILNPYTVEATKTLEQVGKLREDWGSEGMLIDLVHDESTGRKLTLLVGTYLDAVTALIQGNIGAADLHTRRSETWRQARDVLDAFVRNSPR